MTSHRHPGVEPEVTRPSVRCTSRRPRIRPGVTWPSFRCTSLRARPAIQPPGLDRQPEVDPGTGPGRRQEMALVPLHVMAAPDPVRGDVALIPLHVIAGSTRNPSPGARPAAGGGS